MVVSEMGEQWSPQTAPAMQADMPMVTERAASAPKTSSDDGDQDAEGAPGGAGGEGQHAGNDEDDSGQEVRKAASGSHASAPATYSAAPRLSVMALEGPWRRSE